jgi:twitching motility protein PilI
MPMQNSNSAFQTPLQQLFLLEERVRQSGAGLPDEAGLNPRFHGIKCIINGADCVINLHEVAEIIDDRRVTPIPGTVPWIEGVMNYRGTLVPVYRPREFLDASDDADPALLDRQGPLLVIRQDRRGMEFSAIRVNRMIGMQKFRVEDLHLQDNSNTDPRHIGSFADQVINEEGASWYRLDIGALLARMTATCPSLQ